MNLAARPNEDPELDEAVYATTVEERGRGWLDKRGPFTEELRQHIGKCLPQELMILLNLPGLSGRLLELREKQGVNEEQPSEAKIDIFEEKMTLPTKHAPWFTPVVPRARRMTYC